MGVAAGLKISMTVQALNDELSLIADELERSLIDVADQLRSLDKEGSLLVLSMGIQVEAAFEEAAPSEAQQPLPTPDVDEVEDDGVLPNQQAVAQELLGRVLLMRGTRLPQCDEHSSLLNPQSK